MTIQVKSQEILIDVILCLCNRWSVCRIKIHLGVNPSNTFTQSFRWVDFWWQKLISKLSCTQPLQEIFHHSCFCHVKSPVQFHITKGSTFLIWKVFRDGFGLWGHLVGNVTFLSPNHLWPLISFYSGTGLAVKRIKCCIWTHGGFSRS